MTLPQDFLTAPRKEYGQHFLKTPEILQKIAQEMRTYRHVVEIGPGRGALTEHLYALPLESLTLMEIDGRLVPLLREKYPRARCLLQDALTISWDEYPAHAVVGNLPYNVSVPIIFNYLRASNALAPGVFMVQEEVAQRLAAKVGSKKYGRLGVMAQTYAQVTYISGVSPDHFWPRPKVHSAIVRLDPRPDPLALLRRADADDQKNAQASQMSSQEASSEMAPQQERGINFQAFFDHFSAYIEKAFEKRRKMMGNIMTQWPKEDPAWRACGVVPQARPETLTSQQFLALAAYDLPKNVLSDAQRVASS